MFDFRYHALSLVAVLIALVVGLLLGVAIGDRNLVSSAERDLRGSLRHDVNAARAENARLSAQLSFRSHFEDLVYPDLVANRLPTRRIGLLFIGQPSDQINALVRSALDQTGGDLVLSAVLREPPDLAGLAASASPGRYAHLDGSPGLVRPFGFRLGRQLAGSGGTPARGQHSLLDRVRSHLLSSYNGSLQPLDGVVVLRTAHAPAGAAADLEGGLLAGLAASNVPAVGVETSATTPSQISWYRQQNLASVDNLDDIAGRAALVFALAGAHGAYGVKPTAESLLPHVVGTAGHIR